MRYEWGFIYLKMVKYGTAKLQLESYIVQNTKIRFR